MMRYSFMIQLTPVTVPVAPAPNHPVLVAWRRKTFLKHGNIS